MSMVDPGSAKKLPPKKEKITGGVKLKKSMAKKMRPKDAENSGKSLHAYNKLSCFQVSECCTGEKGIGATRSPTPESPAVNGTVSKTGDNPDSVTCKHCKKPVSEAEVASHTPLCLEKKKEKARKKKEAKEAKAREAKAREEQEKDKDADSIIGDPVATARLGDNDADGVIDSTKKTTTKNSAPKNVDSDPKKSKKRKTEGEADKEPKKKKLKKDEPPKPKVPKPKGPVNVEQQCGVALPNGGFCARSLTCKSHSMGAKRSVPGRSLPYDQLLAMYQKRNQAKIQKAALSAAAPLPDDEPPSGPVDSDEEKDAVMAAIARSRPMPLEQHVFVPTTRKYNQIRVKEMLGNALGVRSAGGSGGLFGSSAAGGGGVRDSVLAEGIVQSPVVTGTTESSGGEAHARKPSLAQQAQGRAMTGSSAAVPVRKASVASVGGV